MKRAYPVVTGCRAPADEEVAARQAQVKQWDHREPEPPWLALLLEFHPGGVCKKWQKAPLPEAASLFSFYAKLAVGPKLWHEKLLWREQRSQPNVIYVNLSANPASHMDLILQNKHFLWGFFFFLYSEMRETQWDAAKPPPTFYKHGRGEKSRRGEIADQVIIMRDGGKGRSFQRRVH